MRNCKLAFGTSGLMGASITDRGRVRLLDHAFSEGITHFDTAPLYGLGQAEVVLGKFLVGKRDKVTVATKFGLPPKPVPAWIRPAVPIARFTNRRLPRIRRWVGRAQGVVQAGGESPDKVDDENKAFDGQSILNELHGSLRKLKTDYLDCYLYHECSVRDISDELIDFLNDLVKQGKILRYGIASSGGVAREVLSNYENFDGVIQRPFSLSDPIVRSGLNGSLVHSLFRSRGHSDLVEKVSQKLETLLPIVDSCFPSVSSSCFLKWYLLNTAISRGNTVVFSSRQFEHISENVNLLSSSEDLVPTLRKLEEALN